MLCASHEKVFAYHWNTNSNSVVVNEDCVSKSTACCFNVSWIVSGITDEIFTSYKWYKNMAALWLFKLSAPSSDGTRCSFRLYPLHWFPLVSRSNFNWFADLTILAGGNAYLNSSQWSFQMRLSIPAFEQICISILATTTNLSSRLVWLTKYWSPAFPASGKMYFHEHDFDFQFCGTILVLYLEARIRVADETRGWKTGRFIVFDDSFEHELWFEGASANKMRLVLVLDLWHPEIDSTRRYEFDGDFWISRTWCLTTGIQLQFSEGSEGRWGGAMWRIQYAAHIRYTVRRNLPHGYALTNNESFFDLKLIFRVAVGPPDSKSLWRVWILMENGSEMARGNFNNEFIH